MINTLGRNRLTAAIMVLMPVMLLSTAGAQAQERPIVVIDAGHGGEEAGVVHGDILEKDIILRVAFNMAAEFVKHGFDVRLTRTGDYNVAWDRRREIAEEAGADLLLMLHAMGQEDESVHGAEIYFQEESAVSSRAARLVGEEMEAGGTAVALLPRPWPFLQSPTVPTVMIELGHLSNPLERRALLSDSYHRELARSMMRVTEALAEDGR
jgi:N-acetylmuramoyl-L-alanine amidase